VSMDRPTAFRFYAPEHPELAHTLVAKLSQAIGPLAEQVADGFASDYPDYKERIGVIKGLKQAIAICKEAENELR